MIVLGIETATSIASVGITDADQVVTVQSSPKGGSHARTLLPLIETALADAGLGLSDLGLIAVSIGPGSFTGLRIGLSVAKGLALATGLPVVPVPTLEAYAYGALPREGLVCPVLDARKGEVYGAVFELQGGGGVRTVAEPMAMTPERFADLLATPCTLIGDGVAPYAPLWRQLLGPDAELIPFDVLPPSAATIARLGLARAADARRADLAALEPRYCRLSEAEVVHARRPAMRAEGGDASGFTKLTGGRG